MTNRALRSFLLLFTILHSFVSLGDILPAENSKLHYTTVYFEENVREKTVTYELQVFRDSLSYLKDSPTIVSRKDVPAFEIKDLSWGHKHFWRVNFLNKKGRVISKGAVHMFYIVPRVNSPYFLDTRLEIKTNNERLNAGGLIVIDYMRGICNREGVPVWVLPEIPGFIGPASEIRDMKFTGDNSISLLSDNRPLEIDLEGKVLWSLPFPFVFGADTITFHHDFKKTKRGTYLMLGNKAVYRRVLGDFKQVQDMQRDVTLRNGSPYSKVDVAVLLELDAEGKVIWSWDANEYLKDEDLNYKKGQDGFPQLQSHANALNSDERQDKIYLGFRDLSRIIKINKKTKEVEMSYGEKYPSGEARLGNKVFNHQHDAKPSSRNTLLIFNNNVPKGVFGIASILELNPSALTDDSLVLWKFDLDFDTLSTGRSPSGGNVTELPNSNLLLCAGQLNRIFEVTKKKEVVWDAFIYALEKRDTLWHPMRGYRCSWINDITIPRTFAQAEIVKLHKDNLTFNVKIWSNSAGSESFVVELLSEFGELLHKTVLHDLKPQESLVKDINVKIRSSRPDRLLVRVSPVNNLGKTKNINLNLTMLDK